MQPYIPAYRVSFFQGLREDLANSGIDLKIVAARPAGATKARKDEAGSRVLDRYLTQRSASFAGKSTSLRFIGNSIRHYRPNLIIVEQAVKNLEIYPLMVRHHLGKSAPVGMWGQGKTFSSQQHMVISAAKDWITAHSDWFFSYTQEGANYLVDRGYDTKHITVLQNTIDTRELLADLREVGEEELQAFHNRHQLVKGKTAIFIGAVDPSKGIEFLLESARLVRREIPEFKLLIAGNGVSTDLVQQAESAGDPIIYLGRLEGRLKALALRASDFMMIPQWVGLVAVDSLVAGCPIVTSDHPTHSPEFSYLENRRNSIVVPHDDVAYSGAVIALIRDPSMLLTLQDRAALDSANFTMEQMIDNFASGVRNWLSSK